MLNQHVQDMHIQHLLHHLGGVRGQTNVANHALMFQIPHVGNGSMCNGSFQIRRLIYTMDKAEVDVIRPQGF